MSVCVLQAVEKFKVALSLSPQTVSYMQLGRVHLLNGDTDSAIEVYKKAVKCVCLFLELPPMFSYLEVWWAGTWE